MGEDDKEEQERDRLEKVRQERLVLELEKRAFKKSSRLPQRQKSPILTRYYIAGDNLRPRRNNRAEPAPHTALVDDAYERRTRLEGVPRIPTEPPPSSPALVAATDPNPSQQVLVDEENTSQVIEEVRPSVPEPAMLRNQEPYARTSHLPVAETNVAPEVPRMSSSDSAMEGIIEEGCVILAPYTCSGPECQNSTGISPTLGEDNRGIPIDDGDVDVDMGVEPAESPTKRHSPPRRHIQLSTRCPPMSPSPAGPAHSPRHIDRPTSINMMMFPRAPTPAPTPSPAPAPNPPVLPASINTVFCGIPSPAPTPVPALAPISTPTPKPAPTSQPMAPTLAAPGQPPRNVFQPMNIHTFPAGAATQPAVNRLIAKPRSIARRKDAAGVQIPGLDHLNSGGLGSTGPAQGGERPFLFGAGSGPQQPANIGQVQAQGESFNSGIGTEQQSARWTQPTTTNAAPAPAPAPAGVFSVPPSALAQPAVVSAPAPGPTQPPRSEPVHELRFDQGKVSDADDDEGVAPASWSTQGATAVVQSTQSTLAFFEPSQEDPAAGRLLKRGGSLDGTQKDKLHGCIRAGVTTVAKKVRGAGPGPFGMTLMQASRTNAALKKLLQESCETGPLDDAIEAFISDVFWNFDTAGTGDSIQPAEGHEPILSSTFYKMCVANIKTYMKTWSTLRNV